MARLTVQSTDRDGDKRQFSIEGDDALTDGSNYAARRTAATALLAAIQAIQKQNSTPAAPTTYWQFVSEDTKLEPDISDFANSSQVNTKWQIEFYQNGNAANLQHIPIPCANLDHANAAVNNGRVEIPTGSGVGATVKSTFEAWDTTATVVAIFHDERG